MSEREILILGAGPAGLAAAYELSRKGVACTVLEASDEPGGISRTVEYKGYRFDLGGHRFFTKSTEVNDLWHEVLELDFIPRPRQSRIFYRNHFFAYPMKPMDALLGLGPIESVRIGLSYIWRKLSPHKDTSHLENWICNLFGERLYNHFFKSYTEKVWGIPCNRIASEWGAQRIKGLSLWSAIKSSFKKPGHGKIKTLIDRFEYPRRGPGQMYTAMAEKAQAMGANILYNHRVIKVEREGNAVTAVVAETPDGAVRFPALEVISSIPYTELVLNLEPGLSESARTAAAALKYRSLMTVNLILNVPEVIPDTWIYIHEPSITMGRIQCFKNWSPDMVPDPSTSSLGCEYFVNENEGLWNKPDEELIALAREELGKLGIADPATVTDGFVMRVPKAYPMFDVEYADRVKTIRAQMDPIYNLQPVGRYGMYRYNNMDHSVLTGLLAARNTQGAKHDIWNVNLEQEYHEQVEDSSSS